MNQAATPIRRSAFVPFLLGGLAGLVLGVLLAPRPGREVRRQLWDVAKDATGTRGMEFYEEARAALSSAVRAGRQAYREERERLQAP